MEHFNSEHDSQQKTSKKYHSLEFLQTSTWIIQQSEHNSKTSFLNVNHILATSLLA